ncbi:MAG: hypothetical protein ACJ74T_07870 [Pyrinomonadaceae bacterium]
MRSKPSEITRGRRGERGAALVMSLLVAMLLLAAGGALIATAGMTVSNAMDSTAEVQAYYAADAGLQAALTVVRRNRAGTGGLAANFHTFACGTAAACTNDGDNLSQWLPYGANGRVVLSASPDLSYSVMVTDPSRPTDPANPAANLVAAYIPRYLHVRSTGYGPQGAVKVMEMMVDDFSFDFTARAAVALHSHDTDTAGMSFSIGNSAPHLWNGNDQAGLATALPAFAVTNTKDYDAGDGLGKGSVQGVAEGVIRDDPNNVIGASQLQKLGTSDLDWWLKDATSARLFITQMRAKAVAAGRFNPGDDLGSDANPKFSFVDGDVDITGKSDSSAGLLILTGKFTQKGSAAFHGIILALGEGSVDRDGTPDLGGAMVIAHFDHVWDADTKSYKKNTNNGFLAPTLAVSGGGNSLVAYNSEWVRRAMESMGSRVVGIVEK